MAQIGRINSLTVKGRQSYGIHLDGGESGDILLRDKYVPVECKVGDTIDVFVYVDREDQLQATTQMPKAAVGEFASLQVKTSTSSGAYLDWGLETDLFVPKSEQKANMAEGRSYVVYVLLSEKNNRVIASSKLNKFLSTKPLDYKEGEEVDLLLHARTDLGYNAIINQAHDGMIYKNEVFQKIFVGQQLKGYIKKIREDGKIDLSLQQAGYRRVDDVSQAILDILEDRGGRVGVTDKSSPEEIYALFSVSKKIFKKAVGSLYKQRLITIHPDRIERVGD